MLKKLSAQANRGILLDVIVFLVTVVLMTILSRQFANLSKPVRKILRPAQLLRFTENT